MQCVCICMKHIFDCFAKNTKMLYIRNTNAFICCQSISFTKQSRRCPVNPNSFGSPFSGWEQWMFSLPWAHRGRVGTARAGLELYWHRAGQAGAHSGHQGQSAFPSSWHFSGDGCEEWQCWCTAWRASMQNKCFLSLPPVVPSSGVGGAGLSHPYTHLPAVSARAQS